MRSLERRWILILLLGVCSAALVFAGGGQEAEEETGAMAAEAAAPSAYDEAPMLKNMVEAGELPPVEERLPADPVVVVPNDEIGEYGGTITVGTAPSFEYVLMLSRGDHETIPNLAKSWEFNSDYTELTIFFREGLKWSDGVDFTVDDIMFWYNDYMLNEELNPNVPGQLKIDEEQIVVEKVDDYTVKFVLPRPSPAFIHQMDSTGNNGSIRRNGWMLPRHAFEKYHIDYNADADQLAKDAGYDHWWQLFDLYRNYNKSLEGQKAGMPTFRAWRLVEETPSGIVYERNPYYFKVDPEGNQLPYIDKTIHLDIPDRESRLVRIVNGEFDYVSWGTNIKDFPLLRKNEEAGNYNVYQGRNVWGGDCVFYVNQTYYEEDPVLGELMLDKRFREALSVSINREEVNEIINLGQGTIRQATIHPDTPGFKQEWAEAYTEYDPDRANALLDELGLDKRDGEGWRIGADGETLSIILPIHDGLTQWAEFVRDYWRDVGLKTTIKVMGRRNYVQLGRANGLAFRFWPLDGTYKTAFVAGSGGAFNISTWYCAWGTRWGHWVASEGEEGIEPPEWAKQIREWALQLPAATSESQLIDLTQKIMGEHSDRLLVIGMTGMTPKPIVADKDLGNTRPDAVADAFDLGTTRPNWKEQYYWKTEARRNR